MSVLPSTLASRRQTSVALLLFIVPVVPVRSDVQSRGCSATAQWTTLISDHLRRYPRMEIQDLYKLLLQATLGSEHAAPGLAMVRSYLGEEIGSLGSGPSEPLVDTLGKNGRYARIHLRPFLKRGGNSDRLVEAFMATVRAAPPDTAAFHCALDALEAADRGHLLHFPSGAVSAYVSARRREGLPAAHHSAIFDSTYHPAYRVVAVSLLRGLFVR